MASPFTAVYEYGRPEKLDASPLIKAAQYKQELYDANTSQLQQLITKYAGTDLLRDEEKQYLGDRLNTIVSYVNSMGATDWSRKDITSDIASYVSSAIDNNVMAGVMSAQRYRKHEAEMAEMKKDPKKAEMYSAINDQFATRDLERYMTSGKLGDVYRQEAYIPYTDVNKLILENTDVLKDFGVKTYFTKDGNPYFATISEHKVISETESRKYVDMILGEKGKTQLYIDGWGRFKSYKNEEIDALYDDNIKHQVSQYNELIESGTVALAGASKSQKAAIEQQISSYRGAVTQLGEKLKKSPTIGRDSKSFDLHQSSFTDGWAKLLSYDNIVDQKIDDSGFKYDNEQWNRQYKAQEFAFNSAMSVNKDLREAEKLSIEKNKALTKGEISVDAKGNITGPGTGVAIRSSATSSSGVTSLPNGDPLNEKEGVLAETVYNQYDTDWKNADEAGKAYFESLRATPEGQALLKNVFGDQATQSTTRLTWLLTQGNEVSQSRYANIKQVLMEQAQRGNNTVVAQNFMQSLEKAQGSYHHRKRVARSASELDSRIGNMIKVIDGENLSTFRGFTNGVIKSDGTFDPNGSYLNNNRKFDEMKDGSDEKAGYMINMINSIESDNDENLVTPQQLSFLKVRRKELINGLKDPKAKAHYSKTGSDADVSSGFFSSIWDKAKGDASQIKGIYYKIKSNTIGDDSDRRLADDAFKTSIALNRRSGDYDKKLSEEIKDAFNTEYDIEDINSNEFGERSFGKDTRGYNINGRDMLKDIGTKIDTMNSDLQSQYNGSYGTQSINIDPEVNKAIMPAVKAYFKGATVTKGANVEITVDKASGIANVTTLVKNGKKEELMTVPVRIQDLPQTITGNFDMNEKNYDYDPVNNKAPRSFYMEGEIFDTKNDILTGYGGYQRDATTLNKLKTDAVKELEMIYGKELVAENKNEIQNILSATVGIKGYAPGNGTYVADTMINGNIVERRVLTGDVEKIKDNMILEKNLIAYQTAVQYIKEMILNK